MNTVVRYVGVAVLAVLLSACVSTVRVIDIRQEIPPLQVAKRYPMKAALFIAPSSNTVTAVEGSCGYKFEPYPYEKYFRDSMYGTFSQVFESLELVQSLPKDREYDYVIEAGLKRVDVSCDAFYPYFMVEASVRLLDGNSAVIWARPNRTGKGTQTPMGPFGNSEPASRGIANALWMLAKELGNDLNNQVNAQLKTRKPSQVAAAPAPAAAPVIQPATTSDVDVVPAGQARKARNSYAVVIGIEQYRPKLPKADFATHDARIVTDYLTKVLGYPEENVILLLNERAARSDFEKYFEKWLRNNVEPGSTVFVYFSGHGAPNPKTSDAYLVPYDGDPSFIEETGYSLKRMYAALGKLPSKEVIVALDSCFSGAGGRSVLAKGARPLVMSLQSNVALPKNMTVLSASSDDQISSTYDEKGHGLFTYFMLKGMKYEDVVRKDGSLKIDDLYSYLKPQVERIARRQYNNEQTPQLIEPKK